MMRRQSLDPIEKHIKNESRLLGLSYVAVALSGGADSVASAFALKNTGLEVEALHCNFHLRGEESDRDENFVREFCNKWSIPLIVKEFDVYRYVGENKGCSLEMACRDLRYNWFREEKSLNGYQRIVTGHNANDNIETFFLNLLRGSGTRGLKGMEIDNGFLWRPLLQFHRSEIMEYLNSHNLKFVVDSTNLQCDYRRNYLRNKVLPLLKEVWPGFDTALDKSIKNLSFENRIVEKSLGLILDNNSRLEVSKILEYPAPLLLIKRFIEKAGSYTTTPQEILSSIKAQKPHIRKWRLKNGVVVLHNGILSVEMIHCENGS